MEIILLMPLYILFRQTFFEALNKGELLPIIFFAVFFGLGLAAVGKKQNQLKEFLSGSLEAVFWMINKILKLAPLGCLHSFVLQLLHLVHPHYYHY